MAAICPTRIFAWTHLPFYVLQHLPSGVAEFNSEGRNRIIRVEMPYIPLPEVVAHVLDTQTWYLDPAHSRHIRSTGLMN